MANSGQELQVVPHKRELNMLDPSDLIDALYEARQVCNEKTTAYAGKKLDIADVDEAYLQCAKIENMLKECLGDGYMTIYKARYPKII
ncbi:MAG: hypothetical protein PW843_11120 [Azospirillaceae bacterium]|nr:hypothetical protein [Azospirillaceae bacterium]